MSRDSNELISAYLDGELSPAERAEFERKLASGEVSRQEFEEMKAMTEVTGSVRLASFPDEVWDGFWSQTYNRLERGIGWIFLSIGAVILCSAGAYQFLRSLIEDQSSPWWIRLGTAFVALGLGALFVSVLRERIFVRSTDPYRKVKR